MRAREKMKNVEAELARIRADRDKLDAQEEVLLKLLANWSGEPAPKEPRRRSAPIKPVVLDIMAEVGFTGATTAEVDAAVKRRVSTVAKDSVGSILSRLKSAGALGAVAGATVTMGEPVRGTKLGDVRLKGLRSCTLSAVTARFPYPPTPVTSPSRSSSPRSVMSVKFSPFFSVRSSQKNGRPSGAPRSRGRWAASAVMSRRWFSGLRA